MKIETPTKPPTTHVARDIARIRRSFALLDASLRSYERDPHQRTDKVDSDLRTMAQMCSDLRVEIGRGR